MDHVSEILNQLANDLYAERDNEVSMASEVAGQYITDHNDKAAYRQIDRNVNQLAKSWDRMVDMLRKTAERAEKIEASCENFYGD